MLKMLDCRLTYQYICILLHIHSFSATGLKQKPIKMARRNASPTSQPFHLRFKETQRCWVYCRAASQADAARTNMTTCSRPSQGKDGKLVLWCWLWCWCLNSLWCEHEKNRPNSWTPAFFPIYHQHEIKINMFTFMKYDAKILHHPLFLLWSGGKMQRAFTLCFDDSPRGGGKLFLGRPEIPADPWSFFELWGEK